MDFLVDGYFGQKGLQPGNRYFWKIAVSICITASYRGFEKRPISWLFFSTWQCSVVLLKWCLDNVATKK